MNRSTALAPMLLALGLAVPALAQHAGSAPASPTAASPARSGAPQPAFGALVTGETRGGHRYVAGGVGETEQLAIRQLAGDYSLQIVMAEQSGQYVADANVQIEDAQGNTVLAGAEPAPILLVDLPPGRYMVEAAFKGDEVRRHVTVPSQGSRRVVMHFKSQ